jgi:hypothetical protein
MSAVVEAAGPLVDRHEHVRRITAAWQKTVANIVETGRLLIEAKDDIGYGGFEEMIRSGELPFKRGTAYALIAIADNRTLSDVQHVEQLPASWGTLYQLAMLPKHGVNLEVLIEEGAIHPKMERKDVRALLLLPERDDDLPPGYEGSAEPEDEMISEPGEDGRRRPTESLDWTEIGLRHLEQEWENATAEARVAFVRKRWEELQYIARTGEGDDRRSAVQRIVDRAEPRSAQANATAAKPALDALLEGAVAAAVEQAKRKRGRPPGSKNKPKAPQGADATPSRSEDNAPAPEVGAEIMKAKMAALDDGADPGPMPECLRRAS